MKTCLVSGVDVADDEALGAGVGQRRRPQELAGGAVEDDEATGLAHGDDNLALRSGAGEPRVDPHHRVGIGVDDGVDEGALLHSGADLEPSRIMWVRHSLLSYKVAYDASSSIRAGEINSSRRTASTNPRP